MAAIGLLYWYQGGFAEPISTFEVVNDARYKRVEMNVT